MRTKLRAVLAAALAACTLAVGVVPAAAQVRPLHFAFQVADAIWLVREPTGLYMYFAVGLHIDDPTKARVTRALVGKARCAVARSKNATAIACSGGGRLKKVPESAFEFDPTLEGARLRLPGTRLVWTGEDIIFPDAFADADPSFGAIAFASVDRYATAAGRALGRRLRGRGFNHFGWLEEGVVAGAIRTRSGMRITPDGRVEVRLRTRTP